MTNDERRLSRTKFKSEFDVNEYEKLLKFGFAKNCGKWTSLIFECCHIVIVHVDFKKNWPFSTEYAMCV